MQYLLRRRTVLGGLAALPLLPGCPAPLDATDTPMPGDGGTDAGRTDGRTDAGSDVGALDSGSDAGSDVGQDGGGTDAGMFRWAAGGTAAMTGAAAYPDPFGAAPDPACALTLPTTLGPCFYTSPTRVDVSEGQLGLPVRLAFRVLDPRCMPLAGARLDIWHTANVGLYSGGPIDFCTGGDADARARLYFRGTQTTDARGIVAFDTCFPGAYSGRAVHIHFQVFPVGRPTASIVSQVFFPQALNDEIFAAHPDYTPFPPPDTSNAADAIYRSVGTAAIASYERMDDGAMLAWKDLIVRV